MFNLAIIVSLAAEVYLIANLFVQDKNSLRYARAAVGFLLIPVSVSVAVRSTKIQPASKVVILTGIWVAWVVLAGIAALATYMYWQNGGPYYGPIGL